MERAKQLASQDKEQGTYNWGECLLPLTQGFSVMRMQRHKICSIRSLFDVASEMQHAFPCMLSTRACVACKLCMLPTKACQCASALCCLHPQMLHDAYTCLASSGKVTEDNLGKDFEALLGMLRPEESVSKDDVRVMKEQIFGPNVFWVTETRATDDVLEGGIVVSHNQNTFVLSLLCTGTCL